MAVVTTNSKHYRDIAEAIRAKNGSEERYRPDQMAAAVAGIGDGGGAPVYDGSYRVRPETEEQVLETENKLMRENVTVQAIPYHEVDNLQDGQTVIIGGTEYGN